MDEQLIITAILNGNTEQYRELVQKHQQMIFRTCMGFVHHHQDAEDLTQEVFVKAFQALKSYKKDASFSTWLYRIAINQSLSFIRKNKRQSIFNSIEDLFRFDTSNNQTPETDAINKEKSKLIKEAVDSLPENQKIAFTLSKYDELKQAEIAAIMMLKEGAVESLLQRAKKNLQKKLTHLKK